MLMSILARTDFANSLGNKSASFRAQGLPVWKKLAYAVGAMPYAICTTIIGLYFSIFLLEVVIVSSLASGGLPFPREKKATNLEIFAIAFMK